ncbi:flagellar motor protein MotA [Thalassobaculum fulvum]|uniref:Flagellar motor protein MotA n=1 Tax=Thalassobaculum fulvum TaxID=1633335 RepID=A0A918XX58_9PROT|nr:MotA/TolQ/ExbB proton channel family protein [Thalassobaculum fulvum]GHD60860.1 flagellar motor protein MotA [Thalassobaculum fulvum]
MADGAEYAAPRSGAPVSYDIPSSGTTVDGALLIGLIGAFVLIGGAIMLGDSIRSFLDFPSVLIVLLGTFAVTMVSFSVGEVLGVVPLLLRTVFPPSRNVQRACERALNLAEIARRNGILALDHVLPQLAGEPFLQRAIAMAVDGGAPERVETVLTTEIEATSERLTRAANVLRRAAEVAPAMGLIGTLIGLVQMLANLKDPNAIGPAMAVALLTTFYGAVMAYMVFAPVAAKVDRNAADERQIQQIYMVAASSIARQENPRQLEVLLNTVLPPSQRLDYYS